MMNSKSTVKFGSLVAVLALSLAVPATSVFAQSPLDKAKAAAAKARPAAPAARPAPPPRVAAPPRPAPAPRVAAPSRPAPAPRVAAPPRPAPRIAAPQRATPRVAAPSRPAPSVNRQATQPRFQARQQERAARREQSQRAAQPAARSITPNAASRNAAPAAAAAKTAAKPLTRVERRREQAAERSAIRNVPRAQRAERLREFRAERATQREQRLNSGQPQNAQRGLNPSAQQNAAARRNGAARVTTQQARQGRFAARSAARQAALANNPNAANFRAQRAQWWQARSSRFAARQAWRSGLRAAYIPWYGPVYWPYAYSDIFDYTFWPAGYYDDYWAYAYDDFFDGVFYGQAAPAEVYDDAPAGVAARAVAPVTQASAQQLCKQPASGITAWPTADIEKIGLNAEQKALLDDMKAAGQQAAKEFAASCPPEDSFARTPIGRLDAMTARLEATLKAVQVVQPALDKFYASLNDEQKERFNEIGPKGAAANTPKPSETTAQASADAGKCGDPKPGLTNLPIEKIEDAVKPTDAQDASLKKLEDATNAAVDKLAAACPDDVPMTPPGRLDAMGKRLEAMIDAAQTVKPALAEFYGALSSEQKARFNNLGRTLAANDQ